MNSRMETEIGHLPRTWPLHRLSDVFETQLGKMLSQKAHGGHDPKPYLRNKNVQWGRINASDMLQMDFSDREQAKFRLAPGDLLICEGGVPGRAAIWRGEIKECYYQKGRFTGWAVREMEPSSNTFGNEHWLRFAFDLQKPHMGVSWR